MMMDTEAVVCDWAWWILDLPLPPAIAGDRRSGAQEQMGTGSLLRALIGSTSRPRGGVFLSGLIPQVFAPRRAPPGFGSQVLGQPGGEPKPWRIV
ncbi:unnamed protein product [Caretta caretta]